MPEESVTGTSAEAQERRPHKPRRARRARTPKVRRMIYRFNEETSIAIRKTAEYTGRNHRYVAAIVTEKLREAEREAIRGLVTRTIDHIRRDANAAEAADIAKMEQSPVFVGPLGPITYGKPEEATDAK